MIQILAPVKHVNWEFIVNSRKSGVLLSMSNIKCAGRRRLEPVAIVILSVIMSLASFQLIIESIQKIASFVADKSGKPDFSIPTIVITASTIGK